MGWSVAPWVALVLVGCFQNRGDDGGQFGEESGHGCVPTESVPLGPDEDSPLGFAPDDVTSLVVAADLAFVYDDGPDDTTLHLTPSLTARYAFVDYEWSDPDGGTEAAFTTDCPDRVEIGVDVVFVTDDGLFDEVLELTLAASTPASASASVQPRDFEGDFDPWDFAPDDVDYDEVTAEVHLAFGVGGASGAVSGQAEMDDGEVASSENFSVATFGVSPE